MHFIDTHTHLYAKEFDDDRTDCIKTAIQKGVEQLYLPNIDSSSIDGMLALTQQFPKNCFPMLGLHPCSVNETYKSELSTIESYFEQANYVAIGEIGLDYYWDKTYINEQKAAFNRQINWALDKKLPIVIHTRDSMDDAIELVSKKNTSELTGIFHCFGGTVEQAKAIIDMGFYLGIGGVLTFKNSNLSEIIQNIDLKHLVLETDSPYLTPAPYRGKRNESSYIPLIADKLANVYQIPIEEVAEVTSRNAEVIFNA